LSLGRRRGWAARDGFVRCPGVGGRWEFEFVELLVELAEPVKLIAIDSTKQRGLVVGEDHRQEKALRSFGDGPGAGSSLTPLALQADGNRVVVETGLVLKVNLVIEERTSLTQQVFDPRERSVNRGPGRLGLALGVEQGGS